MFVLFFTVYGSYSKRDLLGHWQWCHLIGRIQFSISFTVQPFLHFAPFQDIITYFYLHTKFDYFRISSFNHSRYIIGASKFRVGHVTTPLIRVIFYPYAGT